MTICEVINFGFSEQYVLDMDVESFDVLVERVLVVRSSSKIEALWRDFVSSQGDKKSVKAMAKNLDPRKIIAQGRQQGDGRSRRS